MRFLLSCIVDLACVLLSAFLLTFVTEDVGFLSLVIVVLVGWGIVSLFRLAKTVESFIYSR